METPAELDVENLRKFWKPRNPAIFPAILQPFSTSELTGFQLPKRQYPCTFKPLFRRIGHCLLTPTILVTYDIFPSQEKESVPWKFA